MRAAFPDGHPGSIAGIRTGLGTSVQPRHDFAAGERPSATVVRI